MTVLVKHSTPADGSFSTTGATAWNADHTLTGVGTMAEQDANAVAVTGGTVNGTTVGATTASTGAFTTLSASSTVSGTGFSTYLASPPAIGGTAPAAGKFTTLESTGTASLGTGSTTYVRAIGDASYPGIFVTGGTNTPLVLQPLGTGALQAQKTDSTATGGNARGANAVDWQMSRTAANQVASGSSSAILSGVSNRASGAESVVIGGDNSAATGVNAVIAGGAFHTASGLSSYIGGGVGSTASGNYSFIGSGDTNTAAGYYNFIGGGYTNSGTSASAVTTQSGTMNATTAVTLSGSNASIKVGQYITGTSIASRTYVAAISGTSLTLSQAASGSSTSTLSFYSPHGVVVGGGNNQATGSYSFIGGGGDAGTAANRNTASGDWSVVAGGLRNTASGEASFIGGGGSFGNGGAGGNTANTLGAAVLAGYSNLASSSHASVLAGGNNTASGLYSATIGGYYNTTRGLTGITVFGSRSSMGTTNGQAQCAIFTLSRQTADATASVLTCDSNTTASGTNQVILPNNSAYTFRGEVVSGVTGGGNSKSWVIEGLIKRGANAAATTLVGSTVTSMYADVGAATWTIALSADTTNGGLAVTFTGQASTTIRTVCQVRTTEMTY